MLKKSSTEHFVDITDYAIYCSSVQVMDGQATIIGMDEIVSGDIAVIRSSLNDFFKAKRGGYTRAYATFRPMTAFIRKATLEAPARARDPAFLQQLLMDDYSIDANQNDIRILNGSDGRPFDPEVALQKDLIFSGALREDVRRSQQFLDQLGIYPLSMEIGSMTTLAAAIDYTAMEALPTIVVEMRAEKSVAFIVFKGNVELIRPIQFGVNHMLPLIQRELDLEDEKAAHELLFSNTFDFTEKAPILLSKFFKELQTSVDYFEVQTGQSVGASFIGSIPHSLNWISKAVASNMNMAHLNVDFSRWLALNSIDAEPTIDLTTLTDSWFGSMGLITTYATPQAASVA